ncbi:septal ring lytic transglycosylase RlpA family protein [Rhodoligotrophos ferricapiens]|uniref:septal ring lytic transglycosylase RlpA family protein n=1 Tax=Rhodoligotrophos ferricapiens TaxID=3069264 RepID=UPI00315C9099
MSNITSGQAWLASRVKLREARFLIAFAALLAITGAVGLSGCSSSKVVQKRDPFAGKGSPIYPGNGPLPRGGGRYHIGKPYEVAGQPFVPREDPNYDKTGVASWYGPKFHRRMTSNGEWFDMDYLTAAHPTLPLPSYVKVTNLANGRSLIVRVNDRGPFVADRVIDLSKRSAELLDVKHKGTGKVRVQYIGPAPLNDKGRHLLAMNDELKRGTSLKYMIAAVDARVGGGGGSAPVMVAESAPSEAPRSAANAPAPVQTASISAAPAASSAAPVITGEGARRYYIQAAALSDPNNAQRARSQLSGIGPVEVSPLNTGSRTLFRVRIGPISDPGSADSALQGVIAAGYPDAIIVPAASY